MPPRSTSSRMEVLNMLQQSLQKLKARGGAPRFSQGLLDRLFLLIWVQGESCRAVCEQSKSTQCILWGWHTMRQAETFLFLIMVRN